MKTLPEPCDMTAPVRQALAAGQPVVALESTIITHGMPYPQNVETALAAEQAIRDGGATPATIAVLDGRIKVGLSGRELRRLAEEAQAPGTNLRKCSLRDLALVLVAKQSGGTTVAATMRIASLAGIRVFATGGIGGVHRGAQESFDVSADLMELARSPVAVVCAGPKAILDLGLTLEVLETQGVPVLGYGTSELPAFWCRESGFGVDAQADSARAVARVLQAHWGLGLASGVLVNQPIAEAHALPRDEVERHIGRAIKAAQKQGIKGKALTPFLLAQLEEATGGISLVSNQSLMVANATLGAAVAVALAAQR